MNSGDTIVAISTPVAVAARAIVRLSGPDAFGLGASVAPGLVRQAGAWPVRLSLEGISVPAGVYAFLAPASVTGEDVVELHFPGNPVLAQMVCRKLIGVGARQAEPGEFTSRAYFNGKLDLSQAEGVAMAVSAASEAELRAARGLLSGELSRRVRPLLDAVAEALALVEAGIDFSEEDITFITRTELDTALQAIEESLDQLLRESRRMEPLTHEPSVALAGWPNAGKSTLLNALCGSRRAIVSPIAGTTRDLLWAEVPLRQGMIRLVDAAGIQPPASNQDTPATEIVRQMLDRALRAVSTADLVVLVQEITDTRPPPVLPRRPDLIVRTKLDLCENEPDPAAPATAGPASDTPDIEGPPVPVVRVSAHSGQGMAELIDRLDGLAFGQPGGDKLALNQRHVRAIEASAEAIRRARRSLERGPELIALELREALDHLGQILGQVTPDDVLGRVFRSFCIGK